MAELKKFNIEAFRNIIKKGNEMLISTLGNMDNNYLYITSDIWQ